jgi:MFS family permease
MRKALRVVLSIITGLVVALVLAIAIEMLSAIVHPLPPDFGGSEDELYVHVQRYPQWVLAIVSVLWAATTFLSCWLAKRIGNRGCGWTVGLLLLAAVLYNVTKLPYPIWFKVISSALQGVVLLAALRFPNHTTPLVTDQVSEHVQKAGHAG